MKAEYEESEGLGCPSKRLFDAVKQSTFTDYTHYMVRNRGNEGEEEGGGGQDGRPDGCKDGRNNLGHNNFVDPSGFSNWCS